MLGGAILAEAAMLDGLKVAETQEYGPKARLVATKAPHHIQTSDSLPRGTPARFPALSLTAGPYLRYARTVAANGTIIAEEELREDLGDSTHVTYLPLRATALSGARTKESLKSSVCSRVKAETVEDNFATLDFGYQLASKVSAAIWQFHCAATNAKTCQRPTHGGFATDSEARYSVTPWTSRATWLSNAG